MSFFKKLVNKKSNKKVVEPIVQLEEIPVIDSYQQEEFMFEEVQNNFEQTKDWDNCKQDEAGPSWTENFTWSVNDQEITSQPSTEQEKLLVSSSSTLTESKKSVNNFKYILELVLFVFVLFTSFLPLRLFFGALLLYRAYLIYPKILLAEGDYIKEVNPFDIMFSQSTINNIFQMDNDIENTIDDLVNSIVKIEDFPIIQTCIIDDIFYSSDNRRLYSF
jgi:hypothetical protein